jgi:hypothetical protein
MRMMTVDVSPGPDGFEHRTFECRRCGKKDAGMMACDPLKSDAVGWLSGELARDSETHDVHQERTIPKPAK